MGVAGNHSVQDASHRLGGAPSVGSGMAMMPVTGPDLFESAPYSNLVQERRLAGSAPVWMVRISQPRGDYPDPPTDDFMLQIPTAGAIGACDLGAGRFAWRAVPGSFAVSPIGAACAYRVETPSDFLVIGLPSRALRPIWPELAGDRPMEFGTMHGGINRDDLITELGQRLWHEAAAGDAGGRLFADSALLTMTALLLRGARTSARLAPSSGGLANWQLRRIAEHAAVHLDRDLSLAELAGLVRLSPFHFARAFRVSTGLPPHRWLVAQRMARAQQLLGTGALSIGEVAAAVGYADPGHFAKLFRRETGMAPATWRRERQR